MPRSKLLNIAVKSPKMSQLYLPLFLEGEVIKGFGRGSRELGCPTGKSNVINVLHHIFKNLIVINNLKFIFFFFFVPIIITIKIHLIKKYLQ